MWLEWVGIRGGAEELRVQCMGRGEMEHTTPDLYRQVIKLDV